MKKNMKKILLGLVAALTVSGGAYAQDYLQDENWGTNPEQRHQNVLIFNYFKDAFELKNFNMAVLYMNQLIENSPKAHENIYIRGIAIYKTKIAQATSLAERNVFVDSLMYVYDKRVDAFGDQTENGRGRGFILKAKAADYQTFRQMDRENIQKFYNEAIEATEGKDAMVLNTYFNVLVEDYKSDLVETDLIMGEYDRLAGFMKESDDPEDGQKVLDNLLLSSGAADCENLERIYRPQYEADLNNVELMTKIVGMLGRAKCENEFLLEVAENLYKVDQAPETALALATLFELRGDYEKSLYYWQESVNNESDPLKKTDYIMRAAASALATSNFRQAATFARECLDIDPNNGLAYMIIGQAYGMSVGSSCSDSFTRLTAYWLVVDNLQRARNLLSGDAAQAEVLTRQINQYSASFPSNEECFFRGLSNGDVYTVNCGWISGRTTVRVGR